MICGLSLATENVLALPVPTVTFLKQLKQKLNSESAWGARNHQCGPVVLKPFQSFFTAALQSTPWGMRTPI